jgi:nucleotide-binding universal stress UspA family protein
MTIATVLALVTDEGESESTLKTAVAIGQKFGAYVEALHVRPQPESVIPVVAGGPSVMSVDMLLEGARASTAERAERAHRLFQDVVLEMSLPLTKVDAEPEVGRFSLARPHNGHNQTSSTAMTAALFEMGRPVLITPPKAPATVGQRLMLAWNDTREAAESVWAALPFAAKADEVTVASVIEANSGVDPDELVRALARHGIAASGTVLDRSKAGVGESLLAAADERKCDLLVMGAYGHSRLQELILGGATKHVLNHAQIPLLMVH